MHFKCRSRKTTFLDNAAMKLLFHIIKVEVMDEKCVTKEIFMSEWLDFLQSSAYQNKTGW